MHPKLRRTLTGSSFLPDGCGMSTTPSFYSGRGANLCDMNDDRLQKIWACLSGPEFPEHAAENFVQMVAGMPSLNATDFLRCLFAFEDNEWHWDDALLARLGLSGVNFDGCKDEHGNYVEERVVAVGVATFANLLAPFGQIDETAAIRAAFLIRHGVLPRGGASRSCGDKIGYSYSNDGRCGDE